VARLNRAGLKCVVENGEEVDLAVRAIGQGIFAQTRTCAAHSAGARGHSAPVAAGERQCVAGAVPFLRDVRGDADADVEKADVHRPPTTVERRADVRRIAEAAAAAAAKLGMVVGGPGRVSYRAIGVRARGIRA
jgi:hypothetical protein